MIKIFGVDFLKTRNFGMARLDFKRPYKSCVESVLLIKVCTFSFITMVNIPIPTAPMSREGGT